MSVPYKWNPSTKTVDFGTNTVIMQAEFEVGDDDKLNLGDDEDVVLVERSTALNAATALSGVILGTPVTPAIAANSLIISDITADGDILLVTNLAGNSQAWLWIDTSASLATLFAAGVSAIEIGAAGIVINEASADRDFRIESNVLSNFLVIDGNACLNGQIAFGGAVPTNPQAFFGIFPAVNASGVTADQSYFHFTLLPSGAVTVPATTAPIVASMNIHEPNITATGAVTDACTVRIVDAPTEGGRNYAFWVDAGASRLDGTAYIGDTDNADVTLGLTINQGAADNQILAFKSSDVAHGFTTLMETDTFGAFTKVDAGADGGLTIFGISDVTIGLVLHGLSVTEDVTDAPSTSSLNSCNARGGVKSGTTSANLGATGNLFGVQNNDGTNEFVVKGDGELYSNQSATVGTFDEHDDAVLAADLSYALSNEYGKIMKYHEEEFQRLGILGEKGQDGGRMFSVTKLNMLTLCAVGQLGRRIKTLCEKVGVKVDPNGLLLEN